MATDMWSDILAAGVRFAVDQECPMPRVTDNRRELYDAGKNDAEIARELGVSKPSIFQWRKCRGLPTVSESVQPGCKPFTDERRRARQNAYDEGLTDQQIGIRVGQNPTRVRGWRHRMGLPSNRIVLPTVQRPKSTAPCYPERHAARMVLYSRGLSDEQIARLSGAGSNGIAKWRYRNGLKAHRRPIKAHRRPAEHHHIRTDPTMDRIRKAIGRFVARDIADDAASEMFIAVLTGAVAIADIERRAKLYRNRATRQYASSYGPLSIDMAIPGTEDLRLIDTLRDHHSSGWIEEMGATVW